MIIGAQQPAVAPEPERSDDSVSAAPATAAKRPADKSPERLVPPKAKSRTEAAAPDAPPVEAAGGARTAQTPVHEETAPARPDSSLRVTRTGKSGPLPAITPPKPIKAPLRKPLSKSESASHTKRARERPPAGTTKSGTREDRPRARSAATSAREGTAGRMADNRGAVQRYRAIVRAHIARHRPASIGRAGTAVVAFALTATGHLRFARLIRSSGSRALDQASLASVRSAAPFPPPPRGLSPAQLRFAIPFYFR